MMMMMTTPLSATTVTPYPSVEFPPPYPVDTNTTATQNNTNNTSANTETPIPTWASTPYTDTFTPNNSVTSTNIVDSSATIPLFNNTTPLPNTDPTLLQWFNTAPVVNSPLDATNPTMATQPTVTAQQPTSSTTPYTPAFTTTPEQSTTPENTPPAWLGKHPTATLLGMGAGTVGGGLIGGSISNHLATNTASNTSNNTDTPQYEGSAKPGFEATPVTGFYADKKTPRFIRDTREKLYYEISENHEIKVRHYNGGKVGEIYTPNTDTPTIRKIDALGDMTVTVGTNNLVTLTHHKESNVNTSPRIHNHNKTTYQLTDKDNGVRLYKHLETPIVNNKNTTAKLKQQFLIHNSGIAIELNAKGDIIRILDMNATIAPKTAPTAKELADALKDKLALFNTIEEEVLSKQAKEAFIAKTNSFIAKANSTLPTINRLLGTPQDPKTAFVKLDKHLQTLLAELKDTPLAPPSTPKKVYQNFTELLQASGVKLELKEAEKKAITEVGEILTKATPGILLGGVIGSAIVFGADYWLQHRKTSVSGSVTAAPQNTPPTGTPTT